MDTPSLQAFLAVAETGSFSAAATRLQLTQPAVSKRIALLESTTGTRLFDRIGRRVGLTEAGRALLPRAGAILREMASAERALRELGGKVRGRLAIGTSHHIGLHRLPPLLREFSRRYPEVDLEIDFMDSEKAHETVLQGRLEFAVVTLDPGGNDPRLLSRTVWEDPLSAMVATEHPLAALPAPCLEDLAAWPAILPGAGTYTGQILRALFAARGIALRVGMSTNYLETLRMLASIGLGWSVLPETMLSSDLHRLPIRGIHLERKLGYVLHRDRSLSNAARALLGLLDEHAGKTVG